MTTSEEEWLCCSIRRVVRDMSNPGRPSPLQNETVRCLVLGYLDGRSLALIEVAAAAFVRATAKHALWSQRVIADAHVGWALAPLFTSGTNNRRGGGAGAGTGTGGGVRAGADADAERLEREDAERLDRKLSFGEWFRERRIEAAAASHFAASLVPPLLSPPTATTPEPGDGGAPRVPPTFELTSHRGRLIGERARALAAPRGRRARASPSPSFVSSRLLRCLAERWALTPAATCVLSSRQAWRSSDPPTRSLGATTARSASATSQGSYSQR